MTLRTWQTLIKPQDQLIYNASVQDGRDSWLPFSIGMGYKFIDFKYEPMMTFQIGPHNKLVLSAFDPTTDARRFHTDGCRSKIAERLAKQGIENQPIPHDIYIRSIPSYKFVISPEGNGIDCHRHYEALLAGCIPVVEDNLLIREKYKGCPMVFTKDYSDITPERLEQLYGEMIDQTFDFSKLLMVSHSEEIQLLIRANGNHWGRTLRCSDWY